MINILDLQQFITFAAKLILASFLGVLLSFRRSPDQYRLSLVEAHALLAISGAVFMIIIAGEITRAVGLLGAASVVRYRYAVRNPRDASTLILSLGIGMACGSDLLVVAFLATILIVLIDRAITLIPESIPFAFAAQREEKVLRLRTRNYSESMKHLELVFKEYGMTYSMVSFEKSQGKKAGDIVDVDLKVYMRTGIDLDELTNRIVHEEILRITWLENERPWF